MFAGGLRPTQMKKLPHPQAKTAACRDPSPHTGNWASEEPDLWTLVEEDKWGHSSLIPASVTSHSQICDVLGVCRALKGPSSAASFLLMLSVPHPARGWDGEVLGQPHCGQHQAKTQHLGTTEAAWMRSMGTSPMHPTAHLSSHAGDEARLDGPA